mmetsp:Transcript_15222/g.15779  ORF Transcript_15222/g.15779 Transcript_15222/m.15779 type:complete len:96 (-) Transcript_15222:276-563(-)
MLITSYMASWLVNIGSKNSSVDSTSSISSVESEVSTFTPTISPGILYHPEIHSSSSSISNNQHSMVEISRITEHTPGVMSSPPVKLKSTGIYISI